MAGVIIRAVIWSLMAAYAVVLSALQTSCVLRGLEHATEFHRNQRTDQARIAQFNVVSEAHNEGTIVSEVTVLSAFTAWPIVCRVK